MLLVCRLLLLLARLGRGALALALGVDLRREGILEAQRDQVHDEHPARQEDAGGLSEEQGGAEEAHGRAPVHGRANYVEREARHHLVEQDSKVVTQERARDAQPQRRRDDKDVAACDECVGCELRVRREEERVRRLFRDGRFVQVVADQAEREDGRGEAVACRHGASAEELRQDLVVIFYTSSADRVSVRVGALG